MQVGDIVKLTHEGYNYLRREIEGITYRAAVGIIVKKYLDEFDDGSPNDKDHVYDVFIGGKIALNLFESEIMLVK